MNSRYRNYIYSCTVGYSTCARPALIDARYRDMIIAAIHERDVYSIDMIINSAAKSNQLNGALFNICINECLNIIHSGGESSHSISDIMDDVGLPSSLGSISTTITSLPNNSNNRKALSTIT